MDYSLFAIGCYIVMRAFQVLFEEQAKKGWYKIVLKVITVGTLYAAIASLIIYYQKILLLGFDPTK